MGVGARRGQVLTWRCVRVCDYTGPCGLGIGPSPRCNKSRKDEVPTVRTTLSIQRLFCVALMHTSSTQAVFKVWMPIGNRQALSIHIGIQLYTYVNSYIYLYILTYMKRFIYSAYIHVCHVHVRYIYSLYMYTTYLHIYTYVSYLHIREDTRHNTFVL